MGLLDFLFTDAVIKSMKKARHNSTQPTYGRKYDYDQGYEEGYDDSCYDHGCHKDNDYLNTYDCDGYGDGCDDDCDW